MLLSLCDLVWLFIIMLKVVYTRMPGREGGGVRQKCTALL